LIAQKADVSPATVSRVLNHPQLVKQDTIDAVYEAMRAFGIDPSKFSSNTSPDNDREIFVLNVPDIKNVFYDGIMEGANAAASAHHCDLIVTQFPLKKGSIADFINLIKSVKANGVILLSHMKKSVLDEIAQITNIVQCSEYNPEADYPYISINNYTSAKTATEYLIACGRNKIAFINGPLTYNYAIERQRGFLDAMNQANLSIKSNWIVNVPKIDFNIAYASVCQILDSHVIPNAIFTSSDILAAAAIRAAHHFDLNVPNDISVVGFDNIQYASMSTPSITTVSQPNFQLGYTACEMLHEANINPETAAKSILLNTEFIIRESTANLGKHS
jgi:LacI family repressor for deo operon, udp, cdd, tsx, nupC, and nupG